jgi:hypothetical protein
MTQRNGSYLSITDDGVPGRELGDQKEIVAFGAYIHLERMADECVWMALQVGRRLVHVNFYAPRKGTVRMQVEEFDNEPLIAVKGK